MYSRSNRRRRHGAELKAAVLAACNEPGASVAAVAQAHGLNANLVHQWRRGRGVSSLTVPSTAETPVPAIDAPAAISTTPVFIPVELPEPRPATTPATPLPPPDIRIELRRGALTVNVQWPTQAAAQCAAWLREFLR